MIINQITYLKVPLDRAHTNIIGDVTETNGINNALTAMAQASFSKIYSPAISVKTSSDDFTLSVPVNEMDLINGIYNYAVISTNEYGTFRAHYFFITNYQSLFNTSISGQCTLKFEYDEYLNNYYDILINSEKQIARRSHIIDIQHFESVEGADSAYPKYNVFANNAPLKEVESTVHRTYIEYGTTINEISSRYIVLWARIYTDGVLYIKHAESNEAYRPDALSYYGVDSTPILFYPYAVVDTEDYSISKGVFWQYDKTNLSLTVNSQAYALNNVSNILEFDLTAYPPFPYTISRRTSVNGWFDISTANYADAAPVYTNDSLNVEKQYVKSYKETFPLIYTVFSDFRCPKYSTEITLPNIDYSKHRTSLPYDNSASSYPNLQYVYYANKKRNVFTPVDGTEVIVAEINTNFQIPYCTYTFYNKYNILRDSVYKSLPFPLNNSGSLPTSISQYDIYQRTKSNQILAQAYAADSRNAISAARGLTSSAMALASPDINVGKVVSGAFDAAEAMNETIIFHNTQNAIAADVRNSQDTFNIPAANANADIIQDYLLIRAMIPVNSDELEAIKQNVNEYGYEEPRYIDPLQQLCDCWDYIKTQKCSLPQIGNLRQRKVCEEMFNRGVTKWNFNHDSFESDYLSCIPQMKKESTNRIRRVYL